MKIPAKMNALVKKLPQKGLWLEKVDVPEPPYGWALLKIRKAAICGTDLHIYKWDEWSQRNIKTPMTIGHEFTGEIVKINGDPRGFDIGEVVTAEGHVVCGQCYNCRGEQQHLCPNTKGIGVNFPGIYAEYAVVPVHNLWRCNKAVPEEIYCMFDPLGNAVHTALSFPITGEDVLVTGAGPIGIMSAAVAKFAGARSVVLTNTSDWRLGLANKVAPGVHTINTKTGDIEKLMKDLGIKDGFGVGLEMSGAESALSLMVKKVRMGGKIALLGLFGKGAQIDWDKVIFGALTIKGIYGREMFKTWQQMSALVEAGLDLSALITHRMPYTDFEKGFELMESKQCGKVILEWQ